VYKDVYTHLVSAYGNGYRTTSNTNVEHWNQS